MQPFKFQGCKNIQWHNGVFIQNLKIVEADLLAKKHWLFVREFLNGAKKSKIGHNLMHYNVFIYIPSI